MAIGVAIIILGVVLLAVTLGAFRGRQTSPTKMPRYQRWLVLSLLATILALIIYNFIRS